jgi:2-polyprenyl-6-hydroxyphenyl methylase/3-demethylubiquinone-9 3-methyltransferase
MSTDKDQLRFAFGANWSRFLANLTDERIRQAEESIRHMLHVSDLRGRRFLDIGCGSGLFSLAARRLGASVFAFDYDPQSVACAEELKRRYFPDDPAWTTCRGSALDADFLSSLGQFDIVYSWGVLHHTGDMWRALTNVVPLVEPGGTLFISIYNDQGYLSRRWTAVKRTYNRLPPAIRWLLPVFFFIVLWWRQLAIDTIKLHPLRNVSYRGRGMSAWTDMVDWVGGYPFEVAKPEAIFEFYRDRGFQLQMLKTCGGGIGCNQYVFTRSAAPIAPALCAPSDVTVSH